MKTSISLAILFFTLGFTSCNRSTKNSDPLYDAQTVQADLFGQILDESGTPIMGALVKANTHTFVTDSNGTFQFVGIQTSKNSTVIEVSKPNYFKGFRTMYIIANEDNYTRIILIEKKNPANFNAGSGGTINVSGGGSITFSANSIVNKNTGAAYTGNVTVYSTWIDPTSEQLGDLIPGSLRGLNDNEEEKLLASYGMVGAELFDDNNQALQIAAGGKAQISFPLPAALSATAPASIPLWYFDETNGMWKEQGTAQIQGGNYVGNVSHFSFWNCDQPIEMVRFEATVKSSEGITLANAKVKITNKLYSVSAYDYTNAHGKVVGFIPKDANLLLEIFIPDCNLLVYSQDFSTTSSEVIMNSIIVTIPPGNLINISGTIVSCTNNIVKNGYIVLNINNFTKFIKASSNGNFVSSFAVCNAPISLNIIAHDADKKVFGINNDVTLNAGNNNLGPLTACGNISSQYIEWSSTVNGIKTSYTITDPLGLFVGGYNEVGLNDFTEINGTDTISQQVGISFAFDGSPSLSGNHYLKYYADHLDHDLLNDTTYSYINSIIPVILSKYDSVGGKIEGSFNGTILGLNIPIRNVKCTFRLTRDQI